MRRAFSEGVRDAVRNADVAALTEACGSEAYYVAVQIRDDWWLWPRRRLTHVLEALAKRAVVDVRAWFIQGELHLAYRTKGGARGRFSLYSDLSVTYGPVQDAEGGLAALQRTWVADKHGRKKEGKPRRRDVFAAPNALR